jgi:hypothetical protein
VDYEARITAAISKGQIKKVVVIDDAFDPPSVTDADAGPLLDFLEAGASAQLLKRARVTEVEIEGAITAINSSEYADEILETVVAKLYSKFVEKFDERLDPAGRFTILKGDNLRKVRPLLRLLGKCPGLQVTRIGADEGGVDFDKLKPEVVFVDYFLDASLAPDAEPAKGRGERARKTSLRILRHVLAARPGAGPSVMLMSSHAVKEEADNFRKEVHATKKVFASRFQFMAKDDLEEAEAGLITIAPAAADALLDLAQTHKFAGALEDALSHWHLGVEEAVKDVWETVTELKLKDYAYLARFRLADEGQSLSSYLEWFFGEVLVDAIARKVDWKQKSFVVLDEGASKNKPGSQIEGAFDGPTDKIAELYYHARVDERPARQGKDLRMGDVYVRLNAPDEVLALLTPDCDLIKRPKKRAAKRATVVAGTLQLLNAPDASVSDFFRKGRKPCNVAWHPKDVRTVEFDEIEAAKDIKLLGTLRPLYAYELQRRVLDSLGRVGLAVAPAMGMTARTEVVVRGRDGPIRLDLGNPEQATCAVIPSRGGKDKPRTVYQRSFVVQLVDKLAEVIGDMHDDSRTAAEHLLRAENQIKFIEKLCRDGQRDNEEALGIVSRLGPQVDDKAAPWCQILVRYHVDDQGAREAVEEGAEIPILAAK